MHGFLKDMVGDGLVVGCWYVCCLCVLGCVCVCVSVPVCVSFCVLAERWWNAGGALMG